MYIRFVVNQIDQASNARLGIFQVAYELRDAGALADYDEKHLKEIFDWFDEHLDEPSSLRRSKKYHTQDKAISWFKDSATPHIKMMYELKALLERYDVIVEVIKTERTGFIVHEDYFQVVAKPFNETNT